jgi:hypothetical protein
MKTKNKLVRMSKVFSLAFSIFLQIYWYKIRRKPKAEWEKLWGSIGKRFRQTLFELEGLLIKIGQILSTRGDLLPPAFLCSTITPKAIDLNGRVLITIVIFLHKQYGFVVFSIFCFCFCRSRPCLLQLLLCSVNKKQKAYPFCLPKSFNDILYLFNMPFFM